MDESVDVISLSSDDGDIADAATLARYHEHEFGRVFHLAGTTYVPQSWEHPLLFYRTNVLGTANVAEFCRRKRIPLTFVSAYIYGNPGSLPITEQCSAVPNNPYALSKFLAEEICEFY